MDPNELGANMVELDRLGVDSQWMFNFVFEEQHLEDTLTYRFFMARSVEARSNTIALNQAGDHTQLVQHGNNNIAVLPQEGGGFHFRGYNDTYLGYVNGEFVAVTGEENAALIHLFKMDELEQYEYTVSSAHEEMGTVSVTDGTLETEELPEDVTVQYYAAVSNNDKKNNGTIKATPINHKNTELHYGNEGYGENKYLFDHWELNDVELEGIGDTINPDGLDIPYNGSNLVAHFKINPNYVYPNSEKQGSSFESMTAWLNDLRTRNLPLNDKDTQKTAEVYDYQNRIYRVDLTTKSSLTTFGGSIDLGFVLDTSNSMKFPSKLVPAENVPIYYINQWWFSNSYSLDQGTEYYLIADEANTSTVFKIYYKTLSH